MIPVPAEAEKNTKTATARCRTCASLKKCYIAHAINLKGETEMVSDIVKRFRGLSFLIISLFIIFGMLVSFSLYAIWPVVTDESEKSVFDKRFESGEIKIDANLFLAGESGHPALSDISKIPRTGIYDEINLKPRRFWAGGGCVDIKAPVKFEGVYAATNYSNPETAYTNSPLFYV